MKNKNYYDDFDDIDDFDMDYDWVYDENLEKHKTKDKVKWIITAIAFLLIAVMLIGLCLQVFGKGKAKPSEWFGKEPEETDALILTPINPEHSAMRLNTARATASNNSQILTATIEPESATNKAVTWSVAWKEPASGWATGKSVSDYITLNSATANPVTVTCSQAFGAQAIITCISQSDPELTATCTVDYKERVTSIESDVTIYGTKYALSNTPTLPYLPNGSINVAVHKSIGSISETYTATVTVQFTDECKQWLENCYGQWGTGYNQTMSFSNGDEFDLTYILSEYNPNCFFIPYYGGGAFGTSYSGEYFYGYLLPDFNEQDFAKLLFTVTLTDSKGNNTVYEYKAKLGDITVAATALSISNSGIIF